MGYVPLFDNLTTGTLHGRWPDIGLWPVILSLANRFGEIDVTPQFIASATGLPVEQVMACMKRFCEPDPDSRTQLQSGCRLQLIDVNRQWGWKVVNHAAYREKARLLSRDAARTASGADAERKRRERSAPVSVSPVSPELPLSYSDSDSKNKNPPTPLAPLVREPRRVRIGDPDWLLDFKLAYPERGGDPGWRSAVHAANARMREGHTPAEFIAGAQRYATYLTATGRIGTEYVKQAATFLGPDKPFLHSWELPAPKSNGVHPGAETAWAELLVSNGEKRDERVQRALDSMGGWMRITLRTSREAPTIKREFCEAWVAAE